MENKIIFKKYIFLDRVFKVDIFEHKGKLFRKINIDDFDPLVKMAFQ